MGDNSMPLINYVVHPVASDGDCGYTAFGITRDHAYELLKTNIVEIQHLLYSAIRETVLYQEFLEYLKEEKVIEKDVTYDDLVSQSDTLASNPSVIQHFIDFDVKKKLLNGGWAHPGILQALTEIQGIQLRIWKLDENDHLIPHSSKEYADYKSSKQTNNQIVDLLFAENNHFQRLDVTVVEDEATPFVSTFVTNNKTETVSAKAADLAEITKYYNNDTDVTTINNLVDKCLDTLETTERALGGNLSAIAKIEELRTEVIEYGQKDCSDLEKNRKHGINSADLIEVLSKKVDQFVADFKAVKNNPNASQIQTISFFKPSNQNCAQQAQKKVTEQSGSSVEQDETRSSFVIV